MKKTQRRITTVMFLVIVIILPLATLFSKKKTVSELENRKLKERPDFSLSGWFDKSFMEETEGYLSDHFAGRENWIRTKISSETAVGKTEINGVYLTAERLMEHIPEPDQEQIKANTDAINRFAEKAGIPVFTMIVPTSAGIYYETLPEHAPQLSQRELIRSVNSQFSSGVSVIDVYDYLYANKDDYIYYRTDHHWTSLGAFCAYSVAIQKLGFNSVALSRFNIEHASSSFYGTYYSKTLYDKIDPDTIDFYEYTEGNSFVKCTVNNGVSETEYDDIYFREFLDQKDKYASYLGTNTASVNIRTNLESDKKILIFKDSYANSFIQFLTRHYSEIEVIDPRYASDYLDYADPGEYSQILFLYNITTFCEDDNIPRLLY